MPFFHGKFRLSALGSLFRDVSWKSSSRRASTLSRSGSGICTCHRPPGKRLLLGLQAWSPRLISTSPGISTWSSMRPGAVRRKPLLPPSPASFKTLAVRSSSTAMTLAGVGVEVDGWTSLPARHGITSSGESAARGIPACRTIAFSRCSRTVRSRKVVASALRLRSGPSLPARSMTSGAGTPTWPSFSRSRTSPPAVSCCVHLRSRLVIFPTATLDVACVAKWSMIVIGMMPRHRPVSGIPLNGPPSWPGMGAPCLTACWARGGGTGPMPRLARPPSQLNCAPLRPPSGGRPPPMRLQIGCASMMRRPVSCRPAMHSDGPALLRLHLGRSRGMPWAFPGQARLSNGPPCPLLFVWAAMRTSAWAGWTRCGTLRVLSTRILRPSTGSSGRAVMSCGAPCRPALIGEGKSSMPTWQTVRSALLRCHSPTLVGLLGRSCRLGALPPAVTANRTSCIITGSRLLRTSLRRGFLPPTTLRSSWSWCWVTVRTSLCGSPRSWVTSITLRGVLCGFPPACGGCSGALSLTWWVVLWRSSCRISRRRLRARGVGLTFAGSFPTLGRYPRWDTCTMDHCGMCSSGLLLVPAGACATSWMSRGSGVSRRSFLRIRPKPSSG